MVKNVFEEIEDSMKEFANGAGDFSGKAPENMIAVVDINKEDETPFDEEN